MPVANVKPLSCVKITAKQLVQGNINRFVLLSSQRIWENSSSPVTGQPAMNSMYSLGGGL